MAGPREPPYIIQVYNCWIIRSRWHGCIQQCGVGLKQNSKEPDHGIVQLATCPTSMRAFRVSILHVLHMGERRRARAEGVG